MSTIRNILIKELKDQYATNDYPKDIVIVVHNQPDYTRRCLQSIAENTKKYRLFLWDNASNQETKILLEQSNPHVLVRSEKNLGYIRPNNILVSLTSSPYIFLLNSDTMVSSGWDAAILGALNRYDVVGYEGGLLDENGFGIKVRRGEDIDYVAGWCMGFRRETYEKYGLFDKNLQFAYGEDSDFCLKVKENGLKLYALHLDYVVHRGGATIEEVSAKMDVFTTFNENHYYLRHKWASYLADRRVLHAEKKI